MDKVIITGHSRGLGEALAQQWLAEGAYVLGLSRRKHSYLAERYEKTFIDIALDLGDSNALTAFLHSSALYDWLGEADNVWLFNNAGSVAPAAVVGEQDDDDIIRSVSLNITAPMLLTNALARILKERQKILNVVHISSGAGRKDYIGWSVYGATKAALDRHASTLATENNDINIVSLAPGVVATDMQQQLRQTKTFPLYQQFQRLYQDNGLSEPKETAQKIVNYCLGKQFAQTTIADIRLLA